MFKNILQLYSLVACLISAFLCLIFTGFLLNHTTAYVFPELRKQYFHYHSLESNAKYIASQPHEEDFYKELIKKSDKEVTEIRLAEKEEFDKGNQIETRLRAIEGIIFHAQWLFLTFIFLLIHSCLYRKSSK